MANEQTVQENIAAVASAEIPAWQQASEREAEQLIERRVAEAIQRITSDQTLPEGAKSQLIAQLRSAAASGNLSAIEQALTRIGNEVIQERDDARDERVIESADEISSRYPDYEYYSPESREYLREMIRCGEQNSPTFSNAKRQYEAVPQAQREQADAELAGNWKKLKQLRNDPEYKEYQEELQLMKDFQLTNTPHGKALLNSIEQREGRDEIRARIEKAIELRVQLAEPVIADMLPKIDPHSREYIEKNYAKEGGGIDTRKALLAWNQISTKEKDAAIKAFSAAHGDMSKLSPEQQKVIHLSSIMVTAEAALPLQAGMAIVERNQALTATLTDKSIDAQTRAQALMKEMRESGYVGANSNLTRKAALDMIETFDNNPNAVQLIRDHDYKAVGQMYQVSLLNDMDVGQKGAAQVMQAPYISNNLVMSLYADAQADMTRAPSWASSRDAEKVAARSEEWRTVERTLSMPEITVERIQAEAIAPLAASPAMAQLEALPKLELPPVVTVEAKPEPAKTEVTRLTAEPIAPLPAVSAIDFGALPPLPSLKEIGVTGGVTVAENGNPPGGKAPQAAGKGPAA